jgi:hypothetical protein
MLGQTEIYDLLNKGKPYTYSFQRYIGQKYILRNGKIGTCVRLDEYYTIVEDDEREWALSNVTAIPYDENNPIDVAYLQHIRDGGNIMYFLFKEQYEKRMYGRFKQMGI